MQIILIAILVITAGILFLLVTKFGKNDNSYVTNLGAELNKSILKIETTLREEFRQNREEMAKVSKDNRMELSESLKELKIELTQTLNTITNQNVMNIKQVNETLDNKLELIFKNNKENISDLKLALEKSLLGVQENFDKNVESFNQLQMQKFKTLEDKQSQLIENTEKKLEQMRETVDEKLNKTLSERLGQSFETVGKQLQAVQEGLGEMRTLATDVGGLKKVLGNVKMRGGIGEVQLSMLLEQILAPSQYEANVKTKDGSKDLVEFAIKLPGKEEGLEQVWLPIDAKFPKDYYEQLQLAHDGGDLTQIEMAQKALETAVKKMAKDISDKYIDPPYTTDFGIMFLPFEGIYAEVVRKASLLDELQRDFKIIVTGPSTLAALLNSLQMGFKTLAIQKRSSEVWKVLGAVKNEFDKFGGLLDKAQKNIQLGLNDIETLVGTRTNVIKRQLKSVEALSDTETKLVLPETLVGGKLIEDEV